MQPASIIVDGSHNFLLQENINIDIVNPKKIDAILLVNKNW